MFANKKEKKRRYADIFSSNFVPREKYFIGELFVGSREELARSLKIFHEDKTEIFFVSTAKNWGYKEMLPRYGEDAVIVNLSRMNRILNLDLNLGLVRVEPGVTFGQLEVFLKENKAPFTAPINGSGPGTSLIGNALQRGISTSLYTDRLSSVMAFDGILENGDFYESSNNKYSFFKYGLGDYLDNFSSREKIAITSMVFKLHPQYSYYEGFQISIKNDASLSNAVNAVRDVLQKLGLNISSITIQNPQRTMLKIIRFPSDFLDENGVIRDEFITSYLRKYSLTKWTIVANLQGEYPIVKAAKQTIMKIFKPLSTDIFFFSEKKLSTLDSIYSKLHHFAILEEKSKRLNLARTSFYARTGHNPIVNVSWPYWKWSKKYSIKEWKQFKESPPDFDKDTRCGISFASAVLPIKGELIEDFIYKIEQICKSHGVEPIISLMNYSDICFFLDLPLLFDKENELETEKVKMVIDKIEALLQEGGYGFRHRY